VLLFTTRRRISEQRMHRSQTVYVSTCPVMDLADDDLLDALSEPSLRYWLGLRKGRYGRLIGQVGHRSVVWCCARWVTR